MSSKNSKAFLTKVQDSNLPLKVRIATIRAMVSPTLQWPNSRWDQPMLRAGMPSRCGATAWPCTNPTTILDIASTVLCTSGQTASSGRPTRLRRRYLAWGLRSLVDQILLTLLMA